MVGIKSLKNSILNQLIYLIQEPVLNDNVKGYNHTILCGPPGTGKTEIAKIIGQMYAKLGHDWWNIRWKFYRETIQWNFSE